MSKIEEYSETITKSYSAPIFGLNEGHVQQANYFLNNNNFKTVRWNLVAHVGGAKSMTLFGEKISRELPYRYGMTYLGAPGAKILGWISKVATGWNVEKALNKFQMMNPGYKIKQTRIIHDSGINCGVYILYTFNCEKNSN
ncbi:hypothetical protein [Paenibacillus sp. DMB5]|uniref:hypothetical protein n=1 Tax=Paenibacillus sp. DMB5 TaxID=1780103 RepID=UPI00076BD54A|nr:hypothetical protein [Paenibacillus sp. DMB5]KUP25805.1 hypothetical protein AWJ19_19470 [Paenibacillus sp. DMB5]